MGSGWDVSFGTQLVHSASSEKNPIHHIAFPQQNLNETTDHFLSKGHNLGVLKHSFAQNFINPNKQSWHSIFMHTAFFLPLKKEIYISKLQLLHGMLKLEGPREDQSHTLFFQVMKSAERMTQYFLMIVPVQGFLTIIAVASQSAWLPFIWGFGWVGGHGETTITHNAHHRIMLQTIYLLGIIRDFLILYNKG